MDLMSIRRKMMGVIAQMANGADFVKGTFTVPSDASSPYIVSLGKTFDKYLFYIEMTDEDKETLTGLTSITGQRGYGFVGKYPDFEINEQTDNQGTLAHTIAPSTGNASRTSANFNQYGTSTQLGLICGGINTNASGRIYQGYSYNYYVVEIK